MAITTPPVDGSHVWEIDIDLDLQALERTGRVMTDEDATELRQRQREVRSRIGVMKAQYGHPPSLPEEDPIPENEKYQFRESGKIVLGDTFRVGMVIGEEAETLSNPFMDMETFTRMVTDNWTIAPTITGTSFRRP